MSTKTNRSSLAREIMRKSRCVLCNFSGKIMQLKTFCLTQICYDVHELSFKGKDKGLLQMDCGVNSSGMYRASAIGVVVFNRTPTASKLRLNIYTDKMRRRRFPTISSL